MAEGPLGFVFTAKRNDNGWGPAQGDVPEQFKGLPFCPFGKGDRLGKAADFVQTGFQRNPYRGEYNIW